MRRVLFLRATTVDLRTRQVRRRAGATTSLTPKEADLLAFLAEAAPATVSMDTLLEAVWAYAPGVRSRTVRSTIHTLRAKVEQAPGTPDHLLTVRGRGYRFVTGVTADATHHADTNARLAAETRARTAPAAALADLLTLSDGDPELHLARARLADQLGRLDLASRELDHARAMGGRWHTPRIALHRASLARRRGRSLEAKVLYSTVLAGTEQPVARARAAIRRAVLRLELGDPGGFEDFARARALLTVRTDPAVQAELDVEEGLHALLLDRPHQAESALWAGLAGAVRVDSPPVASAAWAGLALVGAVAGSAAATEDAVAQVGLGERSEPGVLALTAWAVRLVGDRPRAHTLLGRARQRHALRPNPADAALVDLFDVAWSRGRAALGAWQDQIAAVDAGLARYGAGAVTDGVSGSVWGRLVG